MTEAPTCETCARWSDICARSIDGGPLEALCEAVTGPNSGRYTRASRTCTEHTANKGAPAEGKSIDADNRPGADQPRIGRNRRSAGVPDAC